MVTTLVKLHDQLKTAIEGKWKPRGGIWTATKMAAAADWMLDVECGVATAAPNDNHRHLLQRMHHTAETRARDDEPAATEGHEDARVALHQRTKEQGHAVANGSEEGRAHGLYSWTGT